MKFHRTYSQIRLALAAVAVAVLAPTAAFAANFFVQDTVVDDGIDAEAARVATNLVKNAVAARAADQLVADEYRASYVLQPRLMRLGDSWILTVEKIRGQETLFAAQTKVRRIDQLDQAARSATSAAIDEPSLQEGPRNLAGVQADPAIPYRVAPSTRDRIIVVDPSGSVSGTTTDLESARSSGEIRSDRAADLWPAERKVSYWTIGIGPFLSRRLESDSVMYNFALGHTWDINPRASVKAIGEANFSSSGDGARFFNLAAGANYFFPTRDVDTSPYVTADIGYGFATNVSRDEAEGFSFGTGVGFQFFRTTETTLDLLLRYAVIFDNVNGDGNPGVAGLRMAVNF
jgi:hypothetical protein